MPERVIKYDLKREFLSGERCFINELLSEIGPDGLSIALARVEPGATTVRHALTKVTERYLIIEGKGKVEVGELEPTDVSFGDVVSIPPGVDQRISNLGSSDLLFLCICTPKFTADCYMNREE
ncbi:MAG: cupin domain-containing protein [candidate division Zixibacteria bacterium]